MTRVEHAISVFRTYEQAKWDWDRCAADLQRRDPGAFDAQLHERCGVELTAAVDTKQAVLRMMYEER